MLNRREALAGAVAGALACPLLSFEARAQGATQIRISTAAPPADFLARVTLPLWDNPV